MLHYFLCNHYTYYIRYMPLNALFLFNFKQYKKRQFHPQQALRQGRTAPRTPSGQATDRQAQSSRAGSRKGARTAARHTESQVTMSNPQ